MGRLPFTPLFAALEPNGHTYVDFDVPGWVWVAFIIGISILLVGDLLLVHRRPHVITFREAAIESSIWITIGLSFTLVILFWQGGAAAGEYLAGYLIEKSLSVDNVFVWAVILSYFAVPAEYQFRVLFWGVFGALVLRAGFIFAVALIGPSTDPTSSGFLILTAIRIARPHDEEIHPENNPVLECFGAHPLTTEPDGQKLSPAPDASASLFAVR